MGKARQGLLALALLLAPAAVQAQKSNVWTRSAEVYLDQAIKSSVPQDKSRYLNQALEQAQLATQKDPANALGWQVLGKTYAVMGDAARADSMFDKAETMYAEYTKADAPFRENAWIEAYNAGIKALQAKNLDEAIQHLEAADIVYQGRPSARMTLGSIYSNRGEYDKAIEKFKGALEILQGPASKGLKPEQTKDWQANTELALQRLAQLYGVTKKYDLAVQLYQQQVAANPNDVGLKLALARALMLSGKEAEAKTMFLEVANAPNLSDDDYVEAGAALFRAREFDAAAAAFRKALTLNPYNHAAVYNLAQTLIVQAAPLVEQLGKDTPAARAATAAKITPISQELDKLAQQYLELEPASVSALTLGAQSARIENDLASDAKVKTAAANKALGFLQRRDSLAAEVSDVKLVLGDVGAKLTGTVTNHKLAAGAPIVLTVTFVGKGGTVLDTQNVTVQAPAKEQTVDFEAATKAKDIVGWKYAFGK